MTHSPLGKTASDVSWLSFPPRTALAGAVWVALSGVAALFSCPAHAVRSCENWHSELLGVEGTVEVLPAGTSVWVPAAEHDQLCIGDTVRSDTFGRATIVARDESTIALNTESEVRIGEPATVLETVIELLRGIGHIISRDPRELTFKTPYSNAGLEGTEFDLRVSDERRATETLVFEGTVRVTSPTGSISVPAGETATVQAGSAPVITTLSDPAGELRWAARYAPLYTELPAPDQAPSAAQSGDPEFYSTRAAARLRYGQVTATEADLATAERLAGGSATALALRSVIALGRRDTETALGLAAQARQLAPEAVVPLLALSYALEDRNDVAGASAAVDRAVEIEPQNAIAWTRRAELALAGDDVDDAVAAAERAAALRPTLAAPHTVLGFANLHRLDGTAAIVNFERSIELDPSAPQARLGLGLAQIHNGEGDAGRRQLEIAVALDPSDALIRSYMGKAYDAENRRKVTPSQFALAKNLDPRDPTAWLYDSLHLLGANRPIEGLQDYRAAASRNDDRAVFRGRLYMDEDLATRSSSGIGHLHLEVGFDQLGFLSGWEGIAADPTDYGAHRLLSDIYSTQPRYELARVSELVQSQLLQPVNHTPLQPQLGQPSSFIQNRVGPSELAQTELAPSFTENGLRFRVATVGGGNDTFGDDVALSGVNDRLSYSVAHYGFETAGFRENNDFEQTIDNAFVQFRVSSDTNVQAELRSSKSERGDLALKFDPAHYDPSFRLYEDVDSLRLGLRQDVTDRDTLLVSSIYQDIATGNSSRLQDVHATGDARSLDVQEIHRGERWRIQSGVAYAERDAAMDVTLYDVLVDTPPFPPFVVPVIMNILDADVRQAAAYAYAQVDATDALTVTIGASANAVEDSGLDKDAVNPKIGLNWQLTDRLTLRAAAFETLQGSLTTSRENPQPSLEPVHVAGFNQFLFAANGDAAAVHGVGVDVDLSDRAFAGIELTQRDIESTFATNTLAGPVTEETSTSETQRRAYAYWTPTDQLSFSAEYQYNRLNQDDSDPMFGFTNMRIEKMPIELRYFGHSGVSASLRTSYVHQDGNFVTAPPSRPDQYAQGEDRFWVVDASVGYRLPNRRGLLSLNVDNLFDEEFRFQDIDAENPSIMPERLVYLRFTLAFD